MCKTEYDAKRRGRTLQQKSKKNHSKAPTQGYNYKMKHKKNVTLINGVTQAITKIMIIYEIMLNFKTMIN